MSLMFSSVLSSSLSILVVCMPPHGFTYTISLFHAFTATQSRKSIPEPSLLGTVNLWKIHHQQRSHAPPHATRPNLHAPHTPPLWVFLAKQLSKVVSQSQIGGFVQFQHIPALHGPYGVSAGFSMHFHAPTCIGSIIHAPTWTNASLHRLWRASNALCASNTCAIGAHMPTFHSPYRVLVTRFASLGSSNLTHCLRVIWPSFDLSTQLPKQDHSQTGPYDSSLFGLACQPNIIS